MAARCQPPLATQHRYLAGKLNRKQRAGTATVDAEMADFVMPAF
ncbi:MAG: hypothetical protein AAF609_20145 [Cyanobacteria bacterium P01_C01_bin.120]